MSKKLLIVESPAKAKTIGKYLGADFAVESSVGHIRDLPKESSAIKVIEKGPEQWEFVPTYVVSEGKTKVVNLLKSRVKEASEIYLASDPDREGEAIAWHLREVLSGVAGSKPFYRVTYNEITKTAVMRAVAAPREIDMPLVDAQQARRILDRIVGYEVSPLLWRNINCANNRTLSAGRVQSVALRLLVERQREIEAFKPETFYLMGVEAQKSGDPKTFVAKLARIDGEKPAIRDRESANRVLLDLSESALEVTDLKLQPKIRHALPPFTTSTLQQAASSVLGFSPGKTMSLAQSLYEHGRITYMRTDSVNVSEEARAAAKDFVLANYGEAFYPEKPNFFKSKADAQGAHEAIRPSNVALTPQASKLEAGELKLYDLIWRRFLASQMADARTTVKTLVLVAEKPGIVHKYQFTASATTVDFEGFLKVMKLSLKPKKTNGEEDDETDEVAYLPEVKPGESLQAVRWLSEEKQTKGPTHYSEASLIKALEENGVGRPSTYAATIETLKTRGYAKTEKKKLIPQERGILVCDWLVANMNSLFTVGYTAAMEAELDKVAEQGEPMNKMLSEFYCEFQKSKPKPTLPDREKFKCVLGLLAQVTTWKPSKKIGKRIYDDRAFYESCREQYEAAKRPMSDRQLQFLVRMVLSYVDQIHEAEAELKRYGLGVASSGAPRADPLLVKYCMEKLDKIEGMLTNPFLKSLHDQYDAGKGLSMKQFVILARAVGESASKLPEFEEIKAKLGSFVPGGFAEKPEDPIIPKLLQLMSGITEWRPKIVRGKKVYDDEEFVKSLNEQYARRHSLSTRQIEALKRVARAYKDKIPEYRQHAAELGLVIDNESGDKH